MFFKASQLTLFDVLEYILRLQTEYPTHNQFFTDLHANISLRLEEESYETLYIYEIAAIEDFMKQFPALSEIQFIHKALKEAYIRFLCQQFQLDVAYCIQQEALIKLYLNIIILPDYNLKCLPTLKSEIWDRIRNLNDKTFKNEVGFLHAKLKQMYEASTYDADNPTIVSIFNEYVSLTTQLNEIVLDPNVKEVYQKYQTPFYKKQKINHYFIPAYGSSGGICYGCVSAMVIPAYNPFKQGFFKFTKEVNDFQNNQYVEKNDQAIIKKTRLTLKYICPNLLQQVKNILQEANFHKEKDLLLYLASSSSAHACYLRIENRRILYLDPVHGAYCFQHANEFIEFYVASFLIFPTRKHYTRYELREMRYAPAEVSVSTYKEKLTTLATGPQYPEFGQLLGLLFFHLIWGGIIVNPASFNLFASMMLTFAYIVAMRHKLHGVLAIPNYLREYKFEASFWDDGTESAKALMKSVTEKNKVSSLSVFRPSDEVQEDMMDEAIRFQLS